MPNVFSSIRALTRYHRPFSSFFYDRSPSAIDTSYYAPSKFFDDAYILYQETESRWRSQWRPLALLQVPRRTVHTRRRVILLHYLCGKTTPCDRERYLGTARSPRHRFGGGEDMCENTYLLFSFNGRATTCSALHRMEMESATLFTISKALMVRDVDGGAPTSKRDYFLFLKARRRILLIRRRCAFCFCTAPRTPLVGEEARTREGDARPQRELFAISIA